MAAKKPSYGIEPGVAHPPGADCDENGVNFSIFSSDATGVELLLFDAHDSPEPFLTVTLDPNRNRTFFYWHVYIRGLSAGVHYAYRIDGPADAEQGQRFNRNKVLVDPYAKGYTNTLWQRGDACGIGDNLATSMRSVVIDHDTYDWEGDTPLNLEMKDLVIYEMHVRGFTQSKSSNTKNPGTFDAIVEKIPYLKSLGVNAVELMPVFMFDDKEIFREVDHIPLVNYWGYSTVGYFAPHAAYCVSPEEGRHIEEFRDMVKALHQAGIEVILDVVFNHTSEGNEQGPTIHFRGMDNRIYYYLSPENRAYYMNYSGCGNTVDCNHPVVEKFIIDCLEFWVESMHVDGFRFDEGSILTRGPDGGPEPYPPVLWELELSETFARTKLFAEAWDAGGLFQLGSFPGYRWAEWNGRFRDDVRRFVKGDGGMVAGLASRISGSADIYQNTRHSPLNSINFAACHDGFTLMDVVSYNQKHNGANGEGNRDGVDDNFSWNSGAEGPTDHADIALFREKQIKNFFAILMLSQGVPMLLSGDEAGRTQLGNNNAYCQDNALSWFDWGLLSSRNEIFEFAKKMIALRKANSALRRGAFFTGASNARGVPDVTWHGCRLNAPGWEDPASKVLAFTLGAQDEAEPDLHVMLSADWQHLAFDVPPPPSGRQWYRLADTSLGSPDDFLSEETAVLVETASYLVGPYSSVILVSKEVKPR